jgi:thiol-disulfide isomerase/thioredoxin
MKKLFALVLCSLALACTLLVEGRTPRQSTAAAEASGVRLRGVDGKTYDTGEMRGSVILVSFGATWCLPCRGELTALEQLKKEYAGRPVRFLWVSIEGADEVSDRRLRDYAKELKLTIPVLRDITRSAYSDFAARVPSPLKQSVRTPVPLVVFIDAAGRFSPPGHFGMTSPESYKMMVRTRLDGLLSGPKAEDKAGAR